MADACPDAEWRLLFALSRYGGLRCPSEHLGLRWEDVDWERGRLTIHSPKTEHHAGGATRVVPIFPELHGPLMEVFERAEPGDSHVITRYRRSNQNLRTQLQRIIRRAGLKAWPKRFQNLRSTRQTELEGEHPSFVVCAWLGNSQAVAKAHYLQVTDAHFEAATKAVQNPVQQSAAPSGIDPQVGRGETAETPVFPVYAAHCDSVRGGEVGRKGLEPLTSAV